MANDDDDTSDELREILRDAANPLDSIFGRLGRPRCYDRDGQPISMRRWAQILEDDAYRSVASDYLMGGKVWVSTVLLGLDHRFFGEGPPLIFETMMFNRMTPEEIEQQRRTWVRIGLDFPWDEMDCQRYATEEEAREGHQAMVNAMRFKSDEFERLLKEERKRTQ